MKKMWIILGIIIVIIAFFIYRAILNIPKDEEDILEKVYYEQNDETTSLTNQKEDNETSDAVQDSGEILEIIKESIATDEEKKTDTSNKVTKKLSDVKTTNQVVENKISVAEQIDTKEIPVVDTEIDEVVRFEESINETTQEENSQEIVQQEVQMGEMIETVVIPESKVEIPEGAVGILKIEKLGINQKVVEGHSLDILKTNLGHVTDTAMSKGNIGILGHNSGNAGYFANLWDLTTNDKIEYSTEDGTKIYKVSEVVQIADDDWSKLSNTTDNRITLITCVKNVPEKRWCIQAIEI